MAAKSLHQLGHSDYNTVIAAKFTDILMDLGPEDYELGYDVLTEFGVYMKNIIKNNPNLSSGELAAFVAAF